jgi:hypothetical protein
MMTPNKPTKLVIANQAYQHKPTELILDYQAYQPTKPKLAKI